MAVSTVISNPRPSHRTARVSQDGAFQGTLALDWANGQILTLTGTSQQSAAFDATNDRIVMVSVGGASTVVGGWIMVGTAPSAGTGVTPSTGAQWISQNAPPVAVYVPAGMLIAGLQGANAGSLSMIPALLAGN